MALRNVLLATLAFVTSAAAESGNEIVAKSVAVTQQDWNIAPRYSFIDHEVAAKHGNPQPNKTERVLMIDGSPYNELIAIAGHGLSKEQQDAEARKLARERAKRARESAEERQRRIARYVRERTQDHRMLAEMANAFEYAVTGEDMLEGHKVWVIKASPKPGFVAHDREGRVLKNMDGELWIDQATYQWVKVEAHVTKPVSMYGFLAKVKPGTRFELEQSPVSAALWLPKRFVVTVRASVLGVANENSFNEDDFRDYRLQAQDVQAQDVQTQNGPPAQASGKLPGQ